MTFERAVVRMEYRCLDCGEPAARPGECDSCGGTEFESLAEDHEPDDLDDEVRISPGAGTSPAESAAVAWECSNCGKRHVRNSPPCSRCGGASFRRVDARSAEGDPNADRGGTSTSTDADASTGASGLPIPAVPVGRSEGVSAVGLVLVVAGGLVGLYAGFVGSRTVFYETTGRLPPAERTLLIAGAAVAIAGVVLVLLATRRSEPAIDLER